MSAKGWNKGFFLPFFMFFAVLLVIFAIYSYNCAVEFFYYEKKLCDMTKLYFEARNYAIETIIKVNNIIRTKRYFSLRDLEDIKLNIQKNGYNIYISVEDENSKLDKKMLKFYDINLLNDNNFFTNYSNGILNINTAKKEILRYFFKDMFSLNNFCTERVDNPIKNDSELLFFKQKYFKKKINEKISFSVKSNYFKVTVNAKSKYNKITIVKIVYVNGKVYKIIKSNDGCYE